MATDDLRESVRHLPDQLRDIAVAAADLDHLPDTDGVESVVILGTGGARVAGDVIEAICELRASVPIVATGARCPAWVGERTLAIVVSPSGDDAGAVAAIEAARDAGATLVAVTAGGALGGAAAAWGVPVVSVDPEAGPAAGLGVAIVRRRAVALLIAFSFALGAVEVGIFYVIADLVERAATIPADEFLAQEWPFFLILLPLVLILKPAAQLGQSMVQSLAIGPSLYPLVIWRLHRHTLGQSMRFFEEDFTGRIAQKQQQTAQAVVLVLLDTVTGLGLLFAYVVAMLVLLGATEPWLALVVALWAACFCGSLVWGVPRIRARAKLRAEMRARVTGQL
ncbi:MAG: hypothetical protein AAGE98_15760, partial [Actinomycetota bacterium]